MVDSKEKSICTGCTACMSACPKNCISMEKDELGFQYPVIDHEVCIECGTCDQVCKNASTRLISSGPPKAFGAIANDLPLRLSSSSGGVFTILAQKIISEGGVAFGAAMSSDFYSVEHICARDSSELEKLRGSKYLQSNMGTQFSEVKKLLQNGTTVMFTGTPCQIAGLRAFLSQDYPNLLCVDFICHGVPSVKIWEKYCHEIELHAHGKISAVSFRHKKYSWERFSTFLETDEREAFFKSKVEDPFLRLFLGNYILRPSCYKCKHKGISRKSDITIADFWGVSDVLPELSDGNGTSLIIVQSEKGMGYIEKVSEKLTIVETDAVEAVNHNKAGIRSAKKPANIEAFWQDVESISVAGLADKYAPISAKRRFKTMAVKSPLYGLLKNLMGGGKVNMINGILIIISDIQVEGNVSSFKEK